MGDLSDCLWFLFYIQQPCLILVVQGSIPSHAEKITRDNEYAGTKTSFYLHQEGA